MKNKDRKKYENFGKAVERVLRSTSTDDDVDIRQIYEAARDCGIETRSENTDD